MKLVIKLENNSDATPAQVQERIKDSEQEKARESIQNDPNVQAMQEIFGATIDETSIGLERNKT